MTNIRAVQGPYSLLTIHDLPATDTRRWIPRRKAEVVCAVEGGLLTEAEAMKRYNLSLEEYQGWKRYYDTLGVAGLRTTRVQTIA